MMELQQKMSENLWELSQTLDKSIVKHCKNMAEYAKLLYQLALDIDLYPELSADQLNHIENAVIYHDIGKIYLPKKLLDYSGTLSSGDLEELKKHVDYGMNLFNELLKSYSTNKWANPLLSAIQQSILHHHERYDGKGYPNRLKGNEISVIGRICSLCNYYDILTSYRPKPLALSHDYVMFIIQSQSGCAFDPLLVELMLRNQSVFKEKLGALNDENHLI